jgi:hypothetical protein
MPLNVSLDKFDNMCGWKGIWEKAGEVNSTNTYITNGVGVTIAHIMKLFYHNYIYSKSYKKINSFLMSFSRKNLDLVPEKSLPQSFGKSGFHCILP